MLASLHEAILDQQIFLDETVELRRLQHQRIRGDAAGGAGGQGGWVGVVAWGGAGRSAHGGDGLGRFARVHTRTCTGNTHACMYRCTHATPSRAPAHPCTNAHACARHYASVVATQVYHLYVTSPPYPAHALPCPLNAGSSMGDSRLPLHPKPELPAPSPARNQGAAGSRSQTGVAALAESWCPEREQAGWWCPQRERAGWWCLQQKQAGRWCPQREQAGWWCPKREQAG